MKYKRHSCWLKYKTVFISLIILLTKIKIVLIDKKIKKNNNVVNLSAILKYKVNPIIN
jgi:hypothetical protein